MLKFAANLSLMFNEVEFPQRFGEAKRAGFQGVECLFPYAYPAADLASELRIHGLTQALFNCPPGDWSAGERGLAALPGREQEFRDSLDTALAYARALDCRTLHVMAGIPDSALSEDSLWNTYLENLRLAAQRAAGEGRTVVIEPINSRDMPGYYLQQSEQARRAIEAVGEENLGLQLDLYHCQIMEGDLSTRLWALKALLRHIQIAGVPERHEPDVGEVNYPYLFRVIKTLNYDGWIGCEYRPRGNTAAGLGWLQAELGGS